MDKEILVQYISLKAEIADLEALIRKTKKELKRLEGRNYQVSDSVKGTRLDGTYGNIRITGYPYALRERKHKILKKREKALDEFSEKLLEMVNDVDSCINSLDDSRIRRMIRYRYMDELSWVQVAHRMGKKYTADGCRMTVQRFLEEK